MTNPHESNLLAGLVGERVTVSASVQGPARAHFDTQISVVGILESHPTTPGRFRVVVDAGTFAYFGADDVYLVNPLTKCPPVISIRVDVPKEVAAS
jgi:hypothetical protein